MIVGERRTAGADVLPDLTSEVVGLVAATGGHTCVSVLMPTTPASRMVIADRERLDGLLDDAERRLAAEVGGDHSRLVQELRRQACLAQDSSTRSAVGLFVNHRVSRCWTLPVTVHPKVVVEATFATRDLLRAVHRTPPHLVVRVDELGARVFWVAGRVTLLEAVERLPHGIPRPVAPSTDGADDRSELWERTANCVARVREKRPAPLVLAGDAVLVGELKARAGLLHRLAGEVVGTPADVPGELFGASAVCVEDYLHRRGQQTLVALHDAVTSDPGRVLAGLDDCWAAVSARVPGTLAVEQGYVHPRPGGEGGPVESHDLIDDLLELALEAGNLIAFVEDAQLHEFGGIALLRPAPTSATEAGASGSRAPGS